MLVLTRKLNEQILIGDNIKITLVRVRGNSVRIGIEAPREMRVVRGELAKKEAADEINRWESEEVQEVFAHPQPPRMAPPAIDQSDDSNQPRLLVGRVRCDEDGRVIETAPLAGFMSAT